jgi:hypothetical protein
MTITHPDPAPAPAATPEAVITPAITGRADQLATVTFDLYRDIHKGIRSELFAVTLDAGRLDPDDTAGRIALQGAVGGLIDLLVSHAEHEDVGIAPTLEVHLPDLAEGVARDHEVLETRMEHLVELAHAVAGAGPLDRRRLVHRLHLDLGSFTSAYLRHQDVEERVVMPALETAVGVEAVVELHRGIIGSIPPPELMASLAVMFPAMNVDDRVELLGGMRLDAPPEAFTQVLALVRSVLEPADADRVAERLGLL